MRESRDNRKLLWFAGGVAAGLAGYLAVRYPVESGLKLGRGLLTLQGAQQREIPWSGGTIRYLMVGRGTRPLVIVHGIGDSPESFALFTQGMLRDYRICMPIMPGHPGSPAPAGLQMGHMVQALDAVILREFGGQRVHLLGNSLGGWVAALFAAAASERLASLMLVNPAGQQAEFHPELVVPSTEEEAARTLRSLFGRKADRLPGVTLRAFARAMSQRSEPAVAQMMQAAPRLVEPLERINARTTVVIGERDRVVPPEESLRVADLIPHAGVDIIKGGSHLPHLTDVRALQQLVNRHTTEPHLLEA